MAATRRLRMSADRTRRLRIPRKMTMPIIRRVEYLIACDGPDCYRSEVADWQTREQAEADAAKCHWVKCTYKRWLCPDCAAKANLARADVVKEILGPKQ